MEIDPKTAFKGSRGPRSLCTCFDLLLLQTKDEGRIHSSFAAKVVAAANKDG
jgi:hypothetical protein